MSEGASSIPRDKARIIMDTPGIAKAADGSPIADPGLALDVPVRLLKNGARGLDQSARHGRQGRGAAARISSGGGAHVPARHP